MKNIQLSSTVSFTAQEYAGQGNAILGIRDSGKSYSATFFAEKLLDAKIPFVAFDPIGVWRFLKTPGTGPGYPIVVAGDGGDLPLNVHSAPQIVRAAMQDNIPLVLDLYSMELSKADWRRIVEACVTILLYENKKCGLRHLFFEEAAEFCPQRVGPEQGKVYDAIERLVRMGGNASLGYTLINQRAEEVNKAVLENCDCLFLHRQKGRNSLAALQKWIDFSAGGNAKEIVGKIPGLAQGECFAWLPGSDSPVFVKMPKKRTFHPDRRKPDLTAKANAEKVDVTAFVSVLQKTLPQLAEEAKANDPKELRSEIARLQNRLAAEQRRTMAPTIDPDVLEKRFNEGVAAGANKYQPTIQCMQKALKQIAADAAQAADGIEVMLVAGAKFRGYGKFPEAKSRLSVVEPNLPKTYAPAIDRTKGKTLVSHLAEGQALPKGERAVLIAAAQNGETGASREEISVLAGFKRATRDAYILRARSKGLLEDVNGRIVATPEGIAALGPDFQPLPTGVALQEYWMARLPAGEAKILAALIEAHPRSLSRDALSEMTEFKRATRDAYILRLSTKRLVMKVGAGEVKASDNLF